MSVSRWGALTGALVLAAGAGAPSVSAQNRDTLSRAFEIVGRGVQIGVAVEDLDADAAKQSKGGVKVETVSPDGPADKAGIKAGDTITEFDGERVRSTMQFSRLVLETAADRPVAVAVLRGGQRMNVTVTPERRSRSDDFGVRLLDVPRPARITPTPPTPRAMQPLTEMLRAPGFFAFNNGRRLGVTIEGIDDQLAEYFGVKEGVLVRSVQADSAAQKAGIKAGDVITAINGSKVYDASDLNRAIERLETSGEFTADIVRDKKTQSVKGKVEPREGRTRIRARTII